MHVRVTVMRLVVSVPVLSEQIAVAYSGSQFRIYGHAITRIGM